MRVGYVRRIGRFSWRWVVELPAGHHAGNTSIGTEISGITLTRRGAWRIVERTTRASK